MSEVSRKPDPDAHHAYIAGDYEKAIRLQTDVVNREIRSGNDGINARKLLSLYAFTAGNHELALALLDAIEPIAPEDPEIRENRGVILRKMNRNREAVECLLEAHHLAPERHNICDALTHCYGSLGEAGLVQKFGRLSLELKDAEAEKRKCHWSIPPGPVPSFDSSCPERNVISFSLWGRNPRYLEGAVRNAMVAPDIYPGWTCRFYCDTSVPLGVRNRLRELGAQVVMRDTPASFFDGLLWRFEVAGDAGVDRFLIRDCDSVINVKERVAVDAWLGSGRWFHAMRDFVSHTELLLAGMWGGTGGVLPPVGEMRKVFRPTIAPTRTFDQMLLREVVWPTVRNSVLIHDSVYTGCLGSVPFPPFGGLPPNRHVGQNEAAVGSPSRLGVLGGDRVLALSPFVLTGSHPAANEVVARAIRELPGVSEIEGGTSPGECEAALVAEGRADATHPFVRADPADALCDEWAGHLTGAVFLFVVHRPHGGEGDADSWVSELEAVQRIHRAWPERVELLRWEDLSGPHANQAWSRLLRFLGIPVTDAALDRLLGCLEPVECSGDLLAADGAAGPWMRRLRYGEGKTGQPNAAREESGIGEAAPRQAAIELPR